MCSGASENDTTHSFEEIRYCTERMMSGSSEIQGSAQVSHAACPQLLSRYCFRFNSESSSGHLLLPSEGDFEFREHGPGERLEIENGSLEARLCKDFTLILEHPRADNNVCQINETLFLPTSPRCTYLLYGIVPRMFNLLLAWRWHTHSAT